MITCRDLIDFLYAYHEGELSVEVRQSVDEHLEACPSCVQYLQDYREAIRLAKAAAEEPDQPAPGKLPEGLVKAILAARKRVG